MSVPTPLYQDISKDGFSDTNNWTGTGSPTFDSDLWNPVSTPALWATMLTIKFIGPSVITSGDTFSIACWIFLSSFDDGIIMADYTDSGGGNKFFRLFSQATGGFFFEAKSGENDRFNSNASANSLITGEWMHIACTMDGNTDCNLYVNAVETSYVLQDNQVNNGYTGITASTNLSIGDHSSGSSTPFSGKVTRPKIWNEFLTSDQVLKEYKSELFLLQDVMHFNDLVLLKG